MSELRYKVGDRVIIGANNHDHEYEIGRTVTISKKTSCDYQGAERENGERWYFDDDDIDHEATAKLQYQDQFINKREQNTWRPASEVPEFGRKLLVLWDDKVITTTQMINKESWEELIVKKTSDDNNITHWVYAPEPPKEEKQTEWELSKQTELFRVPFEKTLAIGQHDREVFLTPIEFKRLIEIGNEILNGE